MRTRQIQAADQSERARSTEDRATLQVIGHEECMCCSDAESSDWTHTKQTAGEEKNIHTHLITSPSKR